MSLFVIRRSIRGRDDQGASWCGRVVSCPSRRAGKCARRRDHRGRAHPDLSATSARTCSIADGRLNCSSTIPISADIGGIQKPLPQRGFGCTKARASAGRRQRHHLRRHRRPRAGQGSGATEDHQAVPDSGSLQGLQRRRRRRSMYGPPGCGKTMLARALANECNAEIVCVRAAEVLDPLVGVAEKRLVSCSEGARAQANCPVLRRSRGPRPASPVWRQRQGQYRRVRCCCPRWMASTHRMRACCSLARPTCPGRWIRPFAGPAVDRSIFVPPPDRIARMFVLRNLLNRANLMTRRWISIRSSNELRLFRRRPRSAG